MTSLNGMLPPARRLSLSCTTLFLTPCPTGRPSLTIWDKRSQATRILPLHDLFDLAVEISRTRQLKISTLHVIAFTRNDADRLARHLRKFHTPLLDYSIYQVRNGPDTFEACDRSVMGANRKPFQVIGEAIPDWAWQDFNSQREARQLFAQSLHDHCTDPFHRRISQSHASSRHSDLQNWRRDSKTL